MGKPTPLDTDVAIETPEHIVFRYRVAGPARRAMAYLLDLLICYGAVVILVIMIALAAGGAGVVSAGAEDFVKAGIGFLLVILFCVQWVYFVVVETRWGRSPGKAGLGIRVVTTEGRPIGFTHAALRNLLRAADALPVGYVLGLLSMTLSPRFQRLGDLVAGTMVVVADDHAMADPIRLWPSASPSELRTMADRVGLDPDERMALELFLRRRGRLGVAREHELASMVAPALSARFDYRHPDPARMLALLYDRAANQGREEAPPSSVGAARKGREGASWP